MSGDINKVIKEHVDRHESNIDPQEIWDGINKKRRKQRLIGWFWPMSISLGVLAMISLLVFEGRIDSNAKLESSVIETQQTIDRKLANQTITTQLPKVVPTSKININQNSSSRNDNTFTSIKKPAQNNDTDLKLPMARGYSNEFRKLNVKEEVSSGFTFLPQQIQQQYAIETKHHATAQKLLTESDKIAKEQQDIKTALLDELQAVEQIKSLLVYKRPKLSKTSLPEFSKFIQPIRINPWQVSLASGTGVGTKELRSHAQTSKDYIAQRSSFERAELTINNELLVSYNLSSGWAISSGLQYQKIYDRFEWDGIVLRNITGDNVGILSSLNDELPSSLTAVYYEAEQREIAYHNSYAYIDVPVFISYTISDNKWRPSLSLGVAVNVHKKQKGYIIDQAGIPIALEEMDSGSFKPGLRYMAEISATYPLTKRLALSGQLGGSMRSIEDPFVIAKYQWMDLSLGLRYKL